MEIHKSFDRTLKDLGIKASAISAASGIAESDISKFRNGNQDILGRKIARLLKALPDTARGYFWLLFTAEDGAEVPNLAKSLPLNEH
jgi:DNA-binding Xre family transcriptional regulator